MGQRVVSTHMLDDSRMQFLPTFLALDADIRILLLDVTDVRRGRWHGMTALDKDASLTKPRAVEVDDARPSHELGSGETCRQSVRILELDQLWLFRNASEKVGLLVVVRGEDDEEQRVPESCPPSRIVCDRQSRTETVGSFVSISPSRW